MNDCIRVTERCCVLEIADTATEPRPFLMQEVSYMLVNTDAEMLLGVGCVQNVLPFLVLFIAFARDAITRAFDFHWAQPRFAAQ
jgi:hypothetical protein